MKEVKISWLENQSPTSVMYYSESIWFSWLATPKKDIYKQVTSWHTCRETFIQEISDYFEGDGESWYYPGNFDTSRLRLITCRKHGPNIKGRALKLVIEKDRKWAIESCRLLNIFEAYQGWSRTKLHVGPHMKNQLLTANTFVFVGSQKWLRAPQLLSLYLLILRLGRMYKYTKGFNSLNDLEALEAELKKKKRYLTNQGARDVDWMRDGYKHWTTVLDNHKKLFFSQRIRDNHLTAFDDDGINALVVENNCGNNTTRRVWRKILSEKG